MEPVVTNSNSNTCGEPISSNCVLYAGPTPAGLCGPVTVTSVLQTLTDKSSCCGGTFPPGNTSAYTGQWVNFDNTIPTSGTAIGTSGPGEFATYTISGFGSAGSNVPQYYWTQAGDIRLRGNFVLSFTPNVSRMEFNISIHTFNPLNMPANFTAAQRTFVIVDPSNTNAQVLTVLNVVGLTLSPNGNLDLNVGIFNPGLINTALLVEFGAITFNMS